MQAWYGCSVNIYATEVSLFFLFVVVVLAVSANLAPRYVAMLVHSLLMKSKNKVWLMMQYTLLPHMPALFMQSQALNVRCKMVVLTAIFLHLSNIDFFNKLGLESSEKLI